MPISFPLNPVLNQQHVTGGKTWIWNGSNWAATQTTGTTPNLISVSSSIIPDANVAYDLGASSQRWRDLYLSGNTLDLGGTAIKAIGGNITLTDASNSQIAKSITVGTIQIGTGNTAVTIAASEGGLVQTSSGNTTSYQVITPVR